MRAQRDACRDRFAGRCTPYYLSSGAVEIFVFPFQFHKYFVSGILSALLLDPLAQVATAMPFEFRCVNRSVRLGQVRN